MQLLLKTRPELFDEEVDDDSYMEAVRSLERARGEDLDPDPVYMNCIHPDEEEGFKNLFAMLILAGMSENQSELARVHEALVAFYNGRYQEAWAEAEAFLVDLAVYDILGYFPDGEEE